jgi:hypothetical protein
LYVVQLALSIFQIETFNGDLGGSRAQSPSSSTARLPSIDEEDVVDRGDYAYDVEKNALNRGSGNALALKSKVIHYKQPR